VQVAFAQLRGHTSRMYDLGSSDRLTGAANRRRWDAEMQRAMAISRKNGRPLSVVVFDLDQFGSFNGRHGHQGGDRLLKGMAARWSTQLRMSDVLARLGGDEFGLLMPNSPQWAARAIAERFCSAVPMGLTCSAGVAAWDGVEPAQSFVARAERALRRARTEGGNRVVELWSERALTGRTPGGPVEGVATEDGSSVPWSPRPNSVSANPNGSSPKPDGWTSKQDEGPSSPNSWY